MTNKQIKAVFRKINLTRIVFFVLEVLLLYSLFLKDVQLSLLVLSAFAILLNTLLMNLWEAINEERLSNYDR